MSDLKKEEYIWGTVVLVCLALVLSGFIVFKFAHRNTSDIPQSDRDTNGCYTPDTVRKHYGETDCVDYNVGYTYRTSAGTKFLDQLVNYSSGFVGYIPRGSAASGIDLSAVDHKNIKVTGLIQKYSGYPEIIINDLSQVSIYP